MTAPVGITTVTQSTTPDVWQVSQSGQSVAYRVGPVANGVVSVSGLSPDHLGNVDLSGIYARVVNGVLVSKVKTDGTDQTATVNSELAALYAAGGGVWKLPVGNITIAGQIVLPNSGSAGPTGSTQPPMTWEGCGGHFNGQNALGSGGTRLILTYAGDGTTNNAQIVTRGLGLFKLRNLVLQDTTVGATAPFLYTTLTTLDIEGVAFLGADVGTACKKDAVILGGTLKYSTVPAPGDGYADPNAPFQGYGTRIVGCYFNRVRRAVYGRSFCNQVNINENFFDKGCGTNLANGACIEIDGSLSTAYPGDSCAANVIVGNYMENTGGYTYQVILREASNNVVAFNGAEDSGSLSALVRIEGQTISTTNYPSVNNRILANFVGQGVPLSEDALSAGQNFTVLHDQGTPSRLLQIAVFALQHLNSTGLTIKDTAGNAVLETADSSNRATGIFGPLTMSGNAYSGSAAGSTALTIGNNSTAADASITLNPPSANVGQIQFKRAGVNSWLLYDAASPTLYLRDSVNGVMALTINPGAGTTGSVQAAGSLIAGGQVQPGSGATTARPTAVGVGAMWYDTTLKKSIWWNGTAWTDATGASV